MDNLPDVHFSNAILMLTIVKNRWHGLFHNVVFNHILSLRKCFQFKISSLEVVCSTVVVFFLSAKYWVKYFGLFWKLPFLTGDFSALETTVLLLPLLGLGRNWQGKEWVWPRPSGCLLSTLLSPARVRELCFMMLNHAREARSPSLWSRLCTCYRRIRGFCFVCER